MEILEGIDSNYSEQSKLENLKFPAEKIVTASLNGLNFYSQLAVLQDRWVCKTLDFKKNGTFVDIGCRGPVAGGNNTYAMESQLAWRGVSVDCVKEYIDLWEKSDRDESGAYCLDAVHADYEALFEENNLPEVIDYLSMDLEPPPITLKALFKIPFHKYKFKCITFETDEYRNFGTEVASRMFLEQQGYHLVSSVNRQDDFWVLDEETEL